MKSNDLPLLIVAAIAGAWLAQATRGARVVVVQRERVIGGHDASDETIEPAPLALPAPK